MSDPKKITWTRPSGTTIDLLDTPEMEKFAADNGFTKGKAKAAPKAKAKPKAEPKE